MTISRRGLGEESDHHSRDCAPRVAEGRCRYPSRPATGNTRAVASSPTSAMASAPRRRREDPVLIEGTMAAASTMAAATRCRAQRRKSGEGGVLAITRVLVEEFANAPIGEPEGLVRGGSATTPRHWLIHAERRAARQPVLRSLREPWGDIPRSVS